MILCVAERIHEPMHAGNEARRQHFKERWTGENRTRYVMAMPAMTHGATRGRLVKILGTHEFKVINLLWPDFECGTWDVEEASKSAMAVMRYMSEDEDGKKYTRLLMLGRRVAEAFRIPPDAEWGSAWSIGHDGWEMCRCGAVMVLPHPSGRCRVMNDPHIGTAIRTKVQEFLR